MSDHHLPISPMRRSHPRRPPGPAFPASHTSVDGSQRPGQAYGRLGPHSVALPHVSSESSVSSSRQRRKKNVGLELAGHKDSRDAHHGRRHRPLPSEASMSPNVRRLDKLRAFPQPQANLRSHSLRNQMDRYEAGDSGLGHDHASHLQELSQLGVDTPGPADVKLHQLLTERPRPHVEFPLSHDAMRSGAVVDAWNASYSTERKCFKSFVVFAEIRLREVLAVLDAQNPDAERKPDPQRAAICCDLMYHISSVFGRYESLMKLLVDEVLFCVYHNYRDLAGEPESPQEPKIQVDVNSLFSRCVPFFTLYDNECERSSSLTEELSESNHADRIANMLAVKNSTLFDPTLRMVRKLLFYAWRGEIRKRRVHRERNNRKMIAKWWALWQANRAALREAAKAAAEPDLPSNHHVGAPRVASRGSLVGGQIHDDFHSLLAPGGDENGKDKNLKEGMVVLHIEDEMVADRVGKLKQRMPPDNPEDKRKRWAVHPLPGAQLRGDQDWVADEADLVIANQQALMDALQMDGLGINQAVGLAEGLTLISSPEDTAEKPTFKDGGTQTEPGTWVPEGAELSTRPKPEEPKPKEPKVSKKRRARLKDEEQLEGMRKFSTKGPRMPIETAEITIPLVYRETMNFVAKNNGNGSIHKNTVIEIARDCLIRKYGVKMLANKQLRLLINTIGDSLNFKDNKPARQARFNLFSLMVGVERRPNSGRRKGGDKAGSTSIKLLTSRQLQSSRVVESTIRFFIICAHDLFDDDKTFSQTLATGDALVPVEAWVECMQKHYPHAWANANANGAMMDVLNSLPQKKKDHDMFVNFEAAVFAFRSLHAAERRLERKDTNAKLKKSLLAFARKMRVAKEAHAKWEFWFDTHAVLADWVVHLDQFAHFISEARPRQTDLIVDQLIMIQTVDAWNEAIGGADNETVAERRPRLRREMAAARLQHWLRAQYRKRFRKDPARLPEDARNDRRKRRIRLKLANLFVCEKDDDGLCRAATDFLFLDVDERNAFAELVMEDRNDDEGLDEPPSPATSVQLKARAGSRDPPPSRATSVDQPRSRASSKDPSPRSRSNSKDLPRSRSNSKDLTRSRSNSKDLPRSRASSKDAAK